VTFGVSSLIDWTWFIPGVTVPALVCAGWLAARGPLAQLEPAPADHTPKHRIAPGKAAAVVGIVGALLIVGWFVWQPLHSSDQVSSAINALSRGDAPAALAAAKSAATSDPVSVDPLWELSAIYTALRDAVAGRQELVKATQVQPSNAATWQQLGSFDLQANHPRLARAELETALRLDRTSAFTQQMISQADRALVSAPNASTGSA
jgi:cytochrome c-type biogenesis protein CcmH/NrfG